MVSGPASLRLVRGEAHILGAPLSLGLKVTVRRWRMLPLYAVKDCEVEVERGPESRLEEYAGSTIPEGWWREAGLLAEKAASTPQTAVVLGGIDVGKTTFTVFLANRALLEGLRVSVVDGDVGQSDLGPPCTLGSAQLTTPVFDLFFVQPERLEFAGSTTPSKVRGKLLEVLKRMCRAERQRSRLVILNTDGWISGEEAENYKVELARAVEATTVLGLQAEGELEPILRRLEEEGFSTVRLPASPKVRVRSRSERRDLRWQAYTKYFSAATLRSLSLEQVRLSGLKPQPGAILALYGPAGRMLGIGVLVSLTHCKTLKILTPAKGFVEKVEVGEVLPDFMLKPLKPQE